MKTPNPTLAILAALAALLCASACADPPLSGSSDAGAGGASVSDPSATKDGGDAARDLAVWTGDRGHRVDPDGLFPPPLDAAAPPVPGPDAGAGADAGESQGDAGPRLDGALPASPDGAVPASPDGALAPSPDAAPPPVPAAEVPAADFAAGTFAVLPRLPDCRALPGGGEGPPTIVSNNPEAFDGAGLLMGTARPTQTRGGREHRLRGDFGVYLHHLYRGEGSVWIQVVVTNPTAGDVTVEATGTAYTQDEAGGLGLGQSPDYRVSAGHLLGPPRTALGPTALPSHRPLLIWSGQLGRNREVDGRFRLHTSDDVYVYVVATPQNDLNQAVQGALTDAPGDYRRSGEPPPPFGREAGVYAHDTWRADFAVEVPAPGAEGRRAALAVNTATGGGHPQVQAFPALSHLDGSAAEAVGMYGNVYDLTVRLQNRDGLGPRRVRLRFASLVDAALSRYWDGAARLDGRAIDVRHTPDARTTALYEGVLQPGAERAVHFEAMVPGLTSIPQALLIESLP